MKKVVLNLIATNNYVNFLDNIIESARNLFMNDCELKFIIYTDSNNIQDSDDIKKILIEREPWPMPTLKRFHYFLRGKNEILESDFSFYIDVDSKFNKQTNLSDITNIDKSLIATLHPGFVLVNDFPEGTPERNPLSRAFINYGENISYFCGGFFGADSKSFISMSEVVSKNIDLDLENNIVAVWHDESHINRYFIDNKPNVVLGKGFSCPEDYLYVADPDKLHIIFLDKGSETNKKKLRNG